jgi:hypothetical protein
MDCCGGETVQSATLQYRIHCRKGVWGYGPGYSDIATYVWREGWSKRVHCLHTNQEDYKGGVTPETLRIRE